MTTGSDGRCASRTEPSGAKSWANSSSPSEAVASPSDTLSRTLEANAAATRLEPFVDLLEQRVTEPDVEQRPDDDEHDRHRRRERERQPHAQRDPAHDPSCRSRYPTPRTVSSVLRPNGRSIFPRR